MRSNVRKHLEPAVSLPDCDCVQIRQIRQQVAHPQAMTARRLGVPGQIMVAPRYIGTPLSFLVAPASHI